MGNLSQLGTSNLQHLKQFTSIINLSNAGPCGKKYFPTRHKKGESVFLNKGSMSRARDFNPPLKSLALFIYGSNSSTKLPLFF
jgi:hypothetical protein